MLTWKAVASSCLLIFAGRLAVNADSQGKSFDWCVFAWFVFVLPAHDSLAGG